MTSTKITANSMNLTTREREIMKVLLGKFADYEKRGQGFYLSNGMSTSHITLKCMSENIHAFWPSDMVRYSRDIGGNVYMMNEDTVEKVQSIIRGDIKKIVRKGYIQEFGNEDERRYRPHKDLKGVTL